jgi:hypothetical protein
MQIIIENLLKDLYLDGIDKGIDEIYKYKNSKFVLTSTSNQKNKENEKDIISINLGKCENLLKDIYNISYNDSLYMLEIISNKEGTKIPKIEYEVYYPLENSSNLNKLNLEHCKDTKIDIFIPAKINDTLDKYNPKSDYYNDICTPTTSQFGTDITLDDRRNEFISKNMSLCEENCELVNYNPENEKAKCSCDIKMKIELKDEYKFDKKEFFKNFIDIKNLANLSVLKCYKTVLKIKRLFKNYGFFLISFIMLLYIITLLIFWLKSFFLIQKEINNMTSAVKENEKNNKIEDKNKIKKDIKKHKSKKVNKTRKKKNILNKKVKITEVNKNIELNSKNEKGKKNSETTKRRALNMETKSFNFKKKIKKEKDKKINDLLEKKDFELNSLEYEEAIKFDKRNYFQYYFSLIKNNHPLIVSFIPFKDYNSLVIKMFLFFFSFSLDLTINAIFFTDDTMHKIHED